MLSPQIIQLVKSFESFSSTPYKCSSGVLTIGYGETEFCTPEMVWNEPLASYMLANRLHEYAVNVAKALGSVNPRAIDAFTSLAYNVTGPDLSAILRSQCYKAFQEQRWSDCYHEFLDWNKGNGSIVPGLVRRRKAELHWWLEGELKLDGYRLDQPYLVE